MGVHALLHRQCTSQTTRSHNPCTTLHQPCIAHAQPLRNPNTIYALPMGHDFKEVAMTSQRPQCNPAQGPGFQ